MAGKFVEMTHRDPKPYVEQSARQESMSREEFEEVFKSFYSPLVRFFRSRGIELTVAEDLAQDVLLNVFKGWNTFRGGGGRSVWIYEIAKNVWRNHARSLGTLCAQ
jgi:DNA-directed RNA polymerase specialized sigma24 family protein